MINHPNLVFVLEFPSWVGKIMQNSRELHLKKTNVGCRFHRGVTCRPLFFCFTPRVQLTLSTPEPKPDTRDTHVLLDGNLGWGPTYDTRIRGMKIRLHLHCLFWCSFAVLYVPKGAEAQEFPWQLPPFFPVTAGNAQLVSVPAAIGWHEGRRISNLATDFLKKMDHKDVRVYV